mmetsp:Transcript_84230/g.176272  ORF Transcript_84230/g.176272 Transcript_84230/m.176272 type:complete len:187 (+) Transcript_84230:107-667(+)
MATSSSPSSSSQNEPLADPSLASPEALARLLATLATQPAEARETTNRRAQQASRMRALMSQVDDALERLPESMPQADDLISTRPSTAASTRIPQSVRSSDDAESTIDSEAWPRLGTASTTTAPETTASQPPALGSASTTTGTATLRGLTHSLPSSARTPAAPAQADAMAGLLEAFQAMRTEHSNTS